MSSFRPHATADCGVLAGCVSAKVSRSDQRQDFTLRLTYYLLGAMTSTLHHESGAPALHTATSALDHHLPASWITCALMRPTSYDSSPNLDLARDQAPIYSIRKPA
jgi:hypothetical protein